MQLQNLQGVIRIDAAAICDADLGVCVPGSIVLRRSDSALDILASGKPTEIDHTDLPPVDHTIALPDRLLMPGLINAHTHLDLTHIGVQPHEPGDGFVQWVDMIRAGRRTDPEEIEDAVKLGIDKLLAGGTAAVGDIAGAPGGQMTLAPFRAIAGSPIEGVSYLEFFGIGKSAPKTRDRLAQFFDVEYPAIAQDRVRVGLQPHAPNTVDRTIYTLVTDCALGLDLPLCTHLAETPEEHRFVAEAGGPQRALLERLGVWDDSILDSIGHGRHPVAHLEAVLERSPFLVAHVNDATDEAIKILARTQTRVVYCPRASEYFGAAMHFGPHRYREMLNAGVPVCLGTDSIVNLDTPDRISVLDEMRLLTRRDGVGSGPLLAMVYTHGRLALGLDERRYALSAGSTPAGIVALRVPADAADPWLSAMLSDDPPSWVFPPK
ncbi:MAG: amidohydrolase family protein [Phycisphaerales bacterium]|nr:amidohydrolase family protein [Phycisphaerales bacterium]